MPFISWFKKQSTLVTFLLPFLWLFFSWYTFALLGIFWLPLVGMSLIISVFFWLQAILIHKSYFTPSAYLAFAASLIIAIIALWSHPVELLSGRDQGSLAEAAIRLSHESDLFFQDKTALPFFTLYGPGTALNFPGFVYTENGDLTPAFPLGYIVWLAGFFTLFGTFGISIAQGVLFCATATSMFAILSTTRSRWLATVGTLLFVTNFLPLWFISFTLSENLALLLFLTTLLCLLTWQQNHTRTLTILTLGSALGLALTRIEGWAVLLIISGWILWHFRDHLMPALKNTKGWWLGITSAGLLIIGTLIVNKPYFTVIAKALLKIFEKDIINGGGKEDAVLLWFFLFDFGVFPYFIGAIIASFILLRTKQYFFLLPWLIVIPFLPYLILPSITADIPWMLRRILPALYPTFFILTWIGFIILIKNWSISKRLLSAFLFCVILIGFNVPSLIFYWQTRYTSLLPQIETFSKAFSENDLLLIDKDITGNNFMMPTLPLSLLLKRPSVYFFNPNDLEKLSLSNPTYLIVPTEKSVLYQQILGNRITPHSTFNFINNHIFSTKIYQPPFIPPIAKTTPITIFLVH